MASNDEILFESNFENWKQERAGGLEDVDLFSFYTLDQFLKPFDVTDEELLNGIVDGGNDGGLDAAYLFLNGALITSDTEVDAKSKRKEVHFVFHQGKDSKKGFSYLEINKFRDFCDDLFDLSLEASELEYKYNERLLDFVGVFKSKARDL